MYNKAGRTGYSVPRNLRQRFQRRHLLFRREWQVQRLTGVGCGNYLRHAIGKVWQIVKLETRPLAIARRDGWTFFDQVIRQAIYTAFGELRLCK